MSGSLQHYDYAGEEPMYKDEGWLSGKINSCYSKVIILANKSGPTGIDPRKFGSAIMSGAKFVTRKEHPTLGECNYYQYNSIFREFRKLDELLGITCMGIYVGRTGAIPVIVFASVRGEKPKEEEMEFLY